MFKPLRFLLFSYARVLFDWRSCSPCASLDDEAGRPPAAVQLRRPGQLAARAGMAPVPHAGMAPGPTELPLYGPPFAATASYTATHQLPLSQRHVGPSVAADGWC